MSGKEKNAIWVYISYSDDKIDEVALELLGKGRQLAEASDASMEAVIVEAPGHSHDDLGPLTAKAALRGGLPATACAGHLSR